MNFKSVLNYNNLCNNCKKSVKKIVLAINKKYPAGIKDVEFEQIFFDPKVTMQKKIVPFVLIKHNNEFYGFFRHSDLRHVSSEGKQLLKQGRIILPASVLSVFKNRAIDVHKNARPPVKTPPKEITFSQTKYNSQQLAPTITQLEPKPQQIVQGVRKSFLNLKQRYKKITLIFVLCSIVLVLLFTGIAIGAWQLYLKSHKETKVSAFDLNKITKIKSPEIINARNVYQVEADEIRDSLKYLIFHGIAEYSKGITFKDYDYQLFSNNKGAIFQPVNLSTTGLEIWLMITAAADSKLLMNNTNYLSVKLPALGNNKVSIAGINALTGPKLVSFPDPGNVTEINIRKVYDDVIKQAVNEIANQAQLNVDYSYKIYADENEKEYQSVDLVNSSIDIWIVIRAYQTSKLIMGYSNLIKVTLQNYNKFIELKTDTFIKDMVIASDQFLYVGTFKSIFKVNLETGEQAILTTINDGNFNTMVLGSDGYLYVATSDSIFKVNLETGEQTTLKKISVFNKMLLGSDGYLYVATSDSIFKVNLETGEQTALTEITAFTTMVLGSDGYLYVGTRNFSIIKVNLKTGEQTILINNIGSEYARNMLLGSDGYLYVATANYIIWVNLETAQHSILVEIPYIESIMLGSDGSLYIGNGSAEIFRLNLKTKKNIKISSFDDFGKIYSMVWSAAGYLYTWTKKTYIWKIAV